MSRLPALTPRELAAILRRAGFQESRQRGSHLVMKHTDGREVVVPMHNKTLKRPTMLGIIKQAGFTLHAFEKLI